MYVTSMLKNVYVILWKSSRLLFFFFDRMSWRDVLNIYNTVNNIMFSHICADRIMFTYNMITLGMFMLSYICKLVKNKSKFL